MDRYQQIAVLRDTIEQLLRLHQTERTIRLRYEQALNKIASWPEGDVVSGRFDEPSAARVAREALTARKGEE